MKAALSGLLSKKTPGKPVMHAPALSLGVAGVPPSIQTTPMKGPWAAIASGVISFVKSIPSLSYRLAISLSTLVSSLVVLGLCFALIVIAYIMVFIIRPRMFTVSHSSPFETYMTNTSAEVAEVIVRLSSALSTGTLQPVLSMNNEALDELSSCGDPATDGVETLEVLASRMSSHLSLLALRPSLASDVILYFQYHRSISSMLPDPASKDPKTPVPNMLSRMDLKSEPVFQDSISGETDKVKAAAFHHDVYLPMTKLRKDAVTLSSRINSACGLKSSPEVAKSIMDVHLLRLHLDVYHKQTTLSYETRKSGPGRLPTAIVTLFWWPGVEQIYTKSIPHLWIDAPQDFLDLFNIYDNAWSALGPFIEKIPCYMGHTNLKGDELEAKCNPEGFTEAKGTKGKRVIEGFSIGGLISGLIGLIKSLMTVIPLIAEFVTKFVSDPFGAIIGILMLLLGMLIGLIGYLLYMLLTLTQLYRLPGYLYSFYLSFGYAWVMMLFEISFSILLLIPFAILTLIDLLTSGAVMHLLRCEALPSEWAVQPFTAFDNVRKRLGVMCAVPCQGKSFVPAFGGVACSCMPPDLPPFCPQQQVFRAYRSMPLGDPWMFDGFTADTAFYSMSPDNQQRHMAAAYRRKTGFMGRCYSAASPYSFITRHVCSDLDSLLPDDATPEDKAKLAKLCQQAHCDFGPPPGDDPISHLDDLGSCPEAVMLDQPARASFCSDPPRMVLDGDSSRLTEGLGNAALMIALAACMALVILYALLG